MRYMVIVVCGAMSLLLGACTGTETFSQAVRAGDTIAVGIGLKADATKENTAVVIVDITGAKTRYEVGDSRIRVVTNLYPDPGSMLIVGGETGQGLGVIANTLASEIISGNNKDWSMTTVFFDLPDSIPMGIATIQIEVNGDSTGYSYYEKSDNIKVNVVASGGAPHEFGILGGVLGVEHHRLNSLQRADHYQVNLSGPDSTGPYALQATFAHAPDASVGGSGKAFITNPRGDRRSMNWSDDGTTLSVVITPTRLGGLLIGDYNLHIAGGVSDLVLTDLKTFASDGSEVSGYSYRFLPKINSISSDPPYSSGQQITIYGEHLCEVCGALFDPSVWVGADGTGWHEIEVTSADANVVQFQLPAALPSGLTGVIWLEKYPVGVDSVPFKLM